MCSGTALLYKIPQVLVGENINYKSPGEKWLKERNVSLHIVQDEECIKLMNDFIASRPELWKEDIHEINEKP